MEWSSKTKIFFFDDLCFQQLILKNQIKNNTRNTCKKKIKMEAAEQRKVK